MQKYLFVVAHPDDELLGGGATISKLVREGNEVYVCMMSHAAPTRDEQLTNPMLKGYELLGVTGHVIGECRCMKFKDEDHHNVVRFIEDSIRKFEPTVVITHHPSDLHNDHYITSICCQEAIRLPQRQIGYDKKIKAFYFMEVISSTDFALNHGWKSFKPTHYVSVTDDDIEKKIESLRMYKNVIRDDPYPRSERTIKAIAAVRGSECGVINAEAFQTVFQLEV